MSSKDKKTGSLCGGLKFEPFKPKKKKTLKPKIMDGPGSGYMHPSTLKMLDEEKKKKTKKK